MNTINWICYYTKDQIPLVEFVKTSWPKGVKEIIVDTPEVVADSGDTLSDSFNSVVTTKWQYLSDIILNAPLDSIYGFIDTDIWFFSDPTDILSRSMSVSPLVVQANMPNMSREFHQYFDANPTCNIGFMVIKVTKETKSFFLAYKESINLWQQGLISCEKPVDQHIFNKLLEKGIAKSFSFLDVNLYASKSNCITIQENTVIFHATNCKGIAYKIEIIKKAIDLHKACSNNQVAHMRVEDEGPKFRRV